MTLLRLLCRLGIHRVELVWLPDDDHWDGNVCPERLVWRCCGCGKEKGI
jgi:hypothetical protein